MANPLKRLLGTSTTSAHIPTALDKARAEFAVAEAAVQAAEKSYDDGLLELDKAALRKLLDAAAEAKIDVDQIKAKITKLEGQLEKALASESEDARRERYNRARELSDAARKKLHRDYPKACDGLREILKAIAEAEAAVAESNGDLPAGASRLEGPEADRSTPALWKEVVSEDVVDLWAGVGGQSTPIDAGLQRQVHPDARLRRGVADNGEEALCGRVTTEGGGTLEVVKRKFIRRLVLPDAGGFSVASLASELNLPPLYAGAAPYWEPSTHTPARALAELEKPMRPRPEQQKREPVYEYALAPTRRENIDE
jgi:hypothetical protein